MNVTQLILYHGSDCTIEKPQWRKCSKYRDFGQCFYTTYTRKMASDWAKLKSPTNPIVNAYGIDFSEVESCNLRVKRFKADAEWAKFVYNNRYNKKFKRPNYDIIIGPLADKGLKMHFDKIKTENKSFDEIAAEIEYDKYKSIQVCFCSDFAVRILRKLS